LNAVSTARATSVEFISFVSVVVPKLPTLWVIAVHMKYRCVDHLADVRCIKRRACARSRGRVADTAHDASDYIPFNAQFFVLVAGGKH
jgi:hypothetical protein